VRDIDVAEDGSPFMVMELLDGQPLAELARRPGGVELPDLLRLVDDMLDVLAAAHAQGIIHRDIKPDNLFVLQDGRLKVLDFGIARVRAGAPKLRTRVGATLGTAPYMPPEQIRGAEIDARADLFAVGATMFRLIAKRRVHEAANEAETLVKMASMPAPPLASAAPEVPRDVCLVVDRALMFDRDQRYPDALTMQRDVRALREGLPPPYATAASAASPPGPDAAATSSEALTPDALTRGARPAPGAEQTRPATAFVTEARTTAASPGAMHPGEALPTGARLSDAVTLHRSAASAVPLPSASPLAPISESMTPSPESMRVPPIAVVADPSTRQPIETETRPAMMVLGAAGLGAPLQSAAGGAGTVDPALRAALEPAPASVAAQPAGSPPIPLTAVHPQAPAGGERTLRSVQGPEGQGRAVEPQGYSMATTALPQMTGPASVPVVSAPGPRTQLSGAAPPSTPLAPGESIPVVEPPAPPPRRPLTWPGTDIRVLPLVIVGLIFASIGAASYLAWYLFSDPGAVADSAGSTSSPAPRDTSRAAPRSTPAPHNDGPLWGPQHPTKAPPPRPPR
jgi:serine/threonine-protein kinase